MRGDTSISDDDFAKAIRIDVGDDRASTIDVYEISYRLGHIGIGRSTRIKRILMKQLLKTEITRDQLNASTQAHINEVQRLIRLFATELLKRGEQHDKSKHSPEEADVFDEYSGKLKLLTYGSNEYKACLDAMKPALDHHYQVNRHHPEHFNEGLFGMNLLDLVEMFLDWYAASKRHADGNIYESLDKNFERFTMSVQLKSILVNTADLVTQDMDHSCGNCSGRNFGTETQGQCRATSAVVMNTDGERCLAWGRAVYPKD